MGHENVLTIKLSWYFWFEGVIDDLCKNSKFKVIWIILLNAFLWIRLNTKGIVGTIVIIVI